MPGGANCARVARSLKELEDDSDGTGDPCRSGGAGADCYGGGSLPNQRSLQNMNKSQLARPCTGQESAWRVRHGTPTENARVYHT